jgi:hypothetical protein
MVGQPLAFDALDRGFGTVNVAAPKTDAVIVTEVKLREITVQVGFIWRTDRPKSSFARSFIHG